MPTLPNQATSGKYISVYDAYGTPKVLEIPNGRCVLVFDGQDVRFVTGSDADPFLLPGLEDQEGGSLPAILGITAAGQLLQYKPNTEEEGTGIFVLKSIGGVMRWVQDAAAAGGGIPQDGIGLLFRSASGAVSYIGSAQIEGVYYIKDGVVRVVEKGVVGTYFQMGTNGPFFGDIGGGSGGVTAGSDSATSGIERVQANNPTSSTANYRSPVLLAFDSGGNGLKVTNVNVTVNLAASPGPGGIDTGTLINSRFYHVWLIANETQVAAMFSENIAVPNLSNADGYTHYAYVGLFYVEANGSIRSFYQKGRRFFTTAVAWGNNLSIGQTLALIAGSVSLQTLVPQNARTVSGTVGGSSAETAVRVVEIASSIDGIGRRLLGGVTKGVNGSFKFDATHFEDMLLMDGGNPQMYWKIGSNAAAVVGKRRIEIDGYTI